MSWHLKSQIFASLPWQTDFLVKNKKLAETKHLFEDAAWPKVECTNKDKDCQETYADATKYLMAYRVVNILYWVNDDFNWIELLKETKRSTLWPRVEVDILLHQTIDAPLLLTGLRYFLTFSRAMAFTANALSVAFHLAYLREQKTFVMPQLVQDMSKALNVTKKDLLYSSTQGFNSMLYATAAMSPVLLLGPEIMAAKQTSCADCVKVWLAVEWKTSNGLIVVERMIWRAMFSTGLRLLSFKDSVRWLWAQIMPIVITAAGVQEDVTPEPAEEDQARLASGDNMAHGNEDNDRGDCEVAFSGVTCEGEYCEGSDKLGQDAGDDGMSNDGQEEGGEDMDDIILEEKSPGLLKRARVCGYKNPTLAMEPHWISMDGDQKILRSSWEKRIRYSQSLLVNIF
ncbi:hypothetical protein P691DRAFT_783115 [Macrolepiota fuliginosa MF-IS2]|uniref:Uncharacterized protein n=1 Tax=Macrolepiota fuliginosa MF-IS2 TaxID=1400762 RepID=A0A9P6BW41_9AGAR|nr:hypothetical protein P691DRAFT_783115 [Macrolepiota fuliginosa MF-IS2]